jgi:hypothetical protein
MNFVLSKGDNFLITVLLILESLKISLWSNAVDRSIDITPSILQSTEDHRIQILSITINESFIQSFTSINSHMNSV